MAATIDTLTPVSQVQPDRTVAPLLLLGQLPGAKFTETCTSPIEMPATPVNATNQLPPDIGPIRVNVRPTPIAPDCRRNNGALLVAPS